MQPRCALLWRFGPGDAGYAAVAALAQKMGVTLRCVGDGDLAARVGDLCAGLPAPAFTMPILLPDTPALIVSGLRHTDGSLELFLDLVRQSGAVLPLRAMVTDTSAGWTLLQLLQELHREHEVMHGGR